MTPHDLTKELFNSKDIGQLVHQRRFSNKKAESIQVAEKTFFQLIAANIVQVKNHATGEFPLFIVSCVLTKREMRKATVRVCIRIDLLIDSEKTSLNVKKDKLSIM